MENTKNLIASNIRRLRYELNLTQSELAEKADLSLRGIQDIETGKNSPRSTTLKLIAKALGVSESDLFLDIRKIKSPATDKKKIGDMTLEELIEGIDTADMVIYRAKELMGRHLELDLTKKESNEYLDGFLRIMPKIKKIPIDVLELLSKQDDRYFDHIRRVLSGLEEKKKAEPAKKKSVS